MRVTIISLLAAATLATAQTSPAPVVSNNPLGVSYIAKLPAKAGSKLQGSVTATTSSTGKGVDIKVDISGLPAEGGPFMYHVHEKPVPADGNCTATGAHLDPYKRSEKPACDPTKPETCQTGDLSGKRGNITSDAVHISYSDLYLATNPSDPSFVGNLSIVVHLSNKTRIGCANFNLVQPATNISSTIASSGYAQSTGVHGGVNTTFSASATPTGSNTATGTPISPTVSTGLPLSSSGAQKLVAGAGVLAAGVAAMLL